MGCRQKVLCNIAHLSSWVPAVISVSYGFICILCHGQTSAFSALHGREIAKVT